MLATFGGTWLQRQATAAATLGRNEDVTSLSGRLPLWRSIWNEARQRSVTGFGYGAFWLPEKTRDIGDELKWYPRHAHSAYVEILVNLGFVGLALAASTTVCGAIRAAHLASQSGSVGYRILGTFLVAGLVNGVAEAAFVLPRDLGLFVSATFFALLFMHPSAQQALARPARQLARRLATGGASSARSPWRQAPQHRPLHG